MNARHILITAFVGISLSACNFVPHAIQTRIESVVVCPRCPAEQPQPATPLTADEIHAFTTPPAPQAPGPEQERPFAQQTASQSTGAEPDPGRP